MKASEMDTIEPEVQRLEEAGHWLLRLREDELSEQELEQWLRWCEADPANLQAFERLQSLWRGIPQDSARTNIAAAPIVRAPWNRWKWAAAAASAAGIVLFVAFGYRFLQPGIEVTSRIEAPARVNESSVLPDGSHVTLGAGSAVALKFTRNERFLEMQDGTAFFTVKPDKTRPFTVHAGPVNVTAVGTAFNIRRNGERVVVTVQEGAVKIDKKDGDTLQASAGYQLTYDSRSREARLIPVNPAAELAWREGQLIYNGEPLETVIANVNRYAAKKITLADPRIARLRFTGTVFTNCINTWLGALPRAFPVTVEEEPTQMVLAGREE